MTIREILNDWQSFSEGSLSVALWQENWLDAEIKYVFGAICFYILGLWLALKVLEKLGALIKGELSIFEKGHRKGALLFIGTLIALPVMMMVAGAILGIIKSWLSN